MLHSKALLCGTDLSSMWSTLEVGRLEWLGACSSAHSLKVILRGALDGDERHGQGDESDAVMVWLFALSISITSLKSESEAWSKAAEMEDASQPLKGYRPDLWDPRRPEWAALEKGVREAAERGGSNVDDAWDAT